MIERWRHTVAEAELHNEAPSTLLVGTESTLVEEPQPVHNSSEGLQTTTATRQIRNEEAQLPHRNPKINKVLRQIVGNRFLLSVWIVFLLVLLSLVFLVYWGSYRGVDCIKLQSHLNKCHRVLQLL